MSTPTNEGLKPEHLLTAFINSDQSPRKPPEKPKREGPWDVVDDWVRRFMEKAEAERKAEAAKERKRNDCPDCGHKHAGRKWADICVGCPCAWRPKR